MQNIDVFIPLHSKDYPTLPHCVQSLKRYLRPAPGRITIISTELPAFLRTQLERIGVTHFLDKSAIPGLPPLESFPAICIDGRPNRMSWYFQQFVKLQLASVSTLPHYMVFDSDTILVSPLAVMDNGRSVLFRSDEYHLPYFDTIERLLGFRPEKDRSFVTAYMNFNVDRVNELKALISSRGGGRRWFDLVLDALPRKNNAEFSEFETYGSFMKQFHADEFVSLDDPKLNRARSEFAGHWGRLAYARLAGIHGISYHEFDSSAKTAEQIQSIMQTTRPALGPSMTALLSECTTAMRIKLALRQRLTHYGRRTTS